jgi:tRNA/tmRNA/rRNA uracil-C5-methylase (TrmA/RlmC/RlmD family)
VVLDPPRQGCAPGVIPPIAWRRPEVALHLCCGVDQIPRQLDEWRACGYRPARIVPLDLFAGTAGLEVAVELRAMT